jgi:hypothetical protein
MARRKTSDLKADGIYVARTSYAAGDRRVIRKGTRLRGDDARVLAHPAMWLVADGLTDDELAAAVFDANTAARTR